jgi:NAD(P)-dependent dehydrogenase (short-subunit alcohol dehydrogenase family)
MSDVRAGLVAASKRFADAALEATVVGSFSRVGYQVRSSLGHWSENDGGHVLAGRTVLVTGATSGIGLAAAVRYARQGATVRFLARDETKADVARRRIADAAATEVDVAYDVADMGDFDSLRDFAARFGDANPVLDVLVHNAGALHREFRQAPDGTELTLATHVFGPFLLTGLLLPALRAGGPARVLTMSSGGMYTERFDPADLEMDRGGYDGTVAYARAKRAQVTLNREWARRIPMSEACFHAMHPGWVDTPGVESGLPTFHRVMRPLLRTPDQGADTAVWLASDPAAVRSSGDFWHDRRRRSEHRLPWTRNAEDPSVLWDLCVQRTGLDPMAHHGGPSHGTNR